VSPRESIHRLVIVNRGEAAMRCIRAVKSLRAQEGSQISAVALFTRVDRDAPFVRHADPRSPPISTTIC
jgi:acetyl/propionyl-CoA carboxylase alpha subunit